MKNNYEFFKSEIKRLSFFKTFIFIYNRIFVFIFNMIIIILLYNINAITWDFKINIDCSFNSIPFPLRGIIIGLFVMLFSVSTLTLFLKLLYKTPSN